VSPEAMTRYRALEAASPLHNAQIMQLSMRDHEGASGRWSLAKSSKT
jgi:hypothetical protein